MANEALVIVVEQAPAVRELLKATDDLCAGYDECFTGDLFNLEGLARRYLLKRPAPR